MPRSVLLLVNRDKPEVAGAVDEIRRLVSSRGRIVAELDADSAPLTAEQANGADLVVVLGGDGTLLSQSRRCVSLGLPMLGVNLGKLGFMAEFDLNALRDQAHVLFDGSEFKTQERPLLSVIVERRDSARERITPGCESLALNDAVITAGPPYRMISLRLEIDGHAGPSLTGDGVIVSTPIGSTAYNASAGGPIVSPEAKAKVITPLAAHTLAFRPVVLDIDTPVRIHVDRANEPASSAAADKSLADGFASGTTLVLDGQVFCGVRSGDSVLIRKHDRAISFVRNPRGSYWHTLVTKMRWAAPPTLRPDA